MVRRQSPVACCTRVGFHPQRTTDNGRDRLLARKPAKTTAFFHRSRSTAIAVFARAPRSGRAKTRLIPLLGPRGAAEFQAALTVDALRKIDASPSRISRWLFLAGGKFPDFLPKGIRQAGGVRQGLPKQWRVEPQHGTDLGERLDDAFRNLLRHHSAAVVIGTDSPLLPKRILRTALAELRWCDAVLGPCPDGGFYLIGLRNLLSGLFRDVRWGTPWAFRDMLRTLIQRGLSCAILEPYPDVDRPTDFRALARHLVEHPGARRLAPSVWKYTKPLMAGLVKGPGAGSSLRIGTLRVL